MNNQPDNPQPISPEAQAKQLSQELLINLAKLKNAYNPEEKQQIQSQLLKISQNIISFGTDHVINELNQQKRSIYEKSTAESSFQHQKMRNDVIETVSNPGISDKVENIDQKIISFRCNENDSNLNLLKKLDSISEANGFLTNLAISPLEK